MVKSNKERHIKLVTDLLESKNQDINWYQTKRQAYRELRKYRAILTDHFFWINRERFISLMENFVNNSLEFEQFEGDFSILWWENKKEFDANALNLKRINSIEPNPLSSGFSSLITCIFRQFKALEDEYCTEQDIKASVQEIVEEIKSSNSLS